MDQAVLEFSQNLVDFTRPIYWHEYHRNMLDVFVVQPDRNQRLDNHKSSEIMAFSVRELGLAHSQLCIDTIMNCLVTIPGLRQVDKGGA